MTEEPLFKLIYVIIVGFLMIVVFSGAISSYSEKYSVKSGEKVPVTVTLEGHDYFWIQQYGSYSLTHKGNCRACCGGAENANP